MTKDAAPQATGEGAGETAEPRRCRWCRRALPEQNGRGRPRKYCSQGCRQWDWVSRQRARELELSEGELVVTKTALDSLHDDLYVLACAIDDTEADLEAAGSKPSTDELERILTWLLDAAKPLRRRDVLTASPERSGSYDVSE